MTSKLYTLAAKIAYFIIILLFLEFLIKGNDFSIIPSPTEVASAIGKMYAQDTLIEASLESLTRVAVGFLFALLLAIPTGYLMGRYNGIRNIISLPLEVIRPIPPIAWIPLSLIIFGISDASAYFVIFLGAFYPILTSTEVGIRSVRKGYIEAAKIYGADRLALFRHVELPSSLPSIFGGIVVGIGFSWMVVVAAEMVSANSGLGYQIQLDRQLLRLDSVVAGMVIIGGLGYSLILLVQALERRMLPWLHIKSSKQAASNGYKSAETTVNDEFIFDFAKGGAPLRVQKLSFSYKSGEKILDKISFDVGSGETIAILGKSGVGKTTLLRLIAGLEKIDLGTVELDGKQVNGISSDISMLFQNLELYPWKTVKENVSLPFLLEKYSREETYSQVNYLLNLVGLKNKENQYPEQLSGGQQQRVGLIRALASRPKLLLMDEPFSGLDMETREHLQSEFSQVFNSSGTTVILVTHDIHEACYMADKIIILDPSIKNGMKIIDNFSRKSRGAPSRLSTEYHDMTNTLRRLLAV